MDECIQGLQDHHLPRVEQEEETNRKLGQFVRHGIHSVTNEVHKQHLRAYVEQNADSIKAEYVTIPAQPYYKRTVATLPENIAKNRYHYSDAYDHSRVILKVCIDELDESDYICANYVDGYEAPRRFVAAQSPLSTTINDYWRMVWDSNATQIVCLTKVVEDGFIKCAPYWPKNGGSEMFGKVYVSTISDEMFTDFGLRRYAVERNDETREIEHYYFIAWPDRNAPNSPKSILELIEKLRQSPKNKATNPIVVQCSAGVGRTGCFILIYNMLEMMAKVGYVDLPKYCAKMRCERAYALDGINQYMFVYKSLLETLNKAERMNN
ncbi:Receptor-type tyrosine-protein phosphatase U-like protein [Dinothrombium tinctorium]|uniref:Receptor-type tyrosine-protein phosphatase U-like protein n=1 Tax=Dinothrombium tinctorium TaxID=1965070 RepID=A0A443R5H6_9ACAR|nr:Receptor-type tyrosine-protein phosphatase U-like protein [Dinothrombium tinctorium]